MTCYYPINAWRRRDGPDKATGKWPITFSHDQGDQNQHLLIPCGNCIGCRLDYSKMWAIRCVHESKMHRDNVFVTLTYNNEFIELFENKLINKNIQLFMKRLRKKYNKKYNIIKFFHCAERGGKTNRAHHHLCLFNMDFDDKYLWSVRDGVRLYRSESLERLWDYGNSTIGDVTLESAAYCARYCLKKVALSKWQRKMDDSFVTMSNRGGGIGMEFYKKYKSDMYNHDKVVLGNMISKVPRYYDKIFEEEYPKEMTVLRERRLQNRIEYDRDQLMVKKVYRQEKIKMLQRQLEG